MAKKSKPFPPSWKLLLGLTALVGFGALLFCLPVMNLGAPMSLMDALFTSVSALTVTGLATIPLGEKLSPAGLAALLLLIQIGGVGYMVVAVLIFRILGRSIGLADRLALQDSLGLLNPKAVVQLAQRVLATVLVIEAIGAALFYLHWGDLYPPDKKLLLAVFQSVSAFCNAFFDITTGSPYFREGMPTDPFTWTVGIVLGFLGGLGIPVLYDLITWRPKKRFSLHTQVTFAIKAGITLVGGVLLFLAEARPGGLLEGLSFLDQVLMSLGQTSLARTAGGTLLPNFVALSPGGQLALIAVMFVGAAPASMGGGITTGVFAVMVLALAAYAKGRDKPRIGGREIPHEMTRKAFAILTVSLLLVSSAAFLLLITHPFTLGQAAFEVVSAFATCGLSLGVTGQLTWFGQAVVMLTMIWGRLGALTILFVFARTSPPGRVTYPEEKVLIG